ncbi:MAG TPA: lactate permease LctP family transporter [Acidobacteriaceae bacterium]|nr:lactate permease LctP family transporter [Acidobacteriaceae bacterium]
MFETASAWHQTYSLFGSSLGVSALIAAVPIFVFLLLLGVLRKPAWMAGLVGLGAAFALAVGGYGMPLIPAASAALYGAAFGLFPISWIIFWAIALFRVTSESGKFEIIRGSIGRLTPDPRLQALLIAFAFGAFLEGAAGFGTPVAIAATMLSGLGFSAFSASALCLLANTAPVAFGAIGIPVITLAGITGLPLDKLSSAVGMLCSPVALFIPLYLIVAMAGFRALSGIVLPTLVAGASFAIVQYLVSTFMGPQLSALLAAIVSMLSLILIVRLRRRRLKDRDTTFSEVPGADLRTVGTDGSSAPPQKASGLAKEHSAREVAVAWMPYVFLVGCVILWGVAPIHQALNRATLNFNWPGLHDLVLRMPPVSKAPSPYHAPFSLNFISAAGTACMVATFLSAFYLRIGLPGLVGALTRTTKQLAVPIATVALVLAVGFLMNYCGATATLGLAFASTGRLFPFFSPLLGVLGVFLTGSDTSSNALFGNLQVVTASRLGLDPVLMAAANASGGVMGKMISLQSIAVAAAATRLSNHDQGRLFRFTLKHSLFLAFVIGCLAMLYAYRLHL